MRPFVHRRLEKSAAPGGGGGGGGGDGGYTTDPDLSEQHDAEVRATRRRLWGRWASQPRLLPGAIWSRLAFEMRPFVHRRLEKSAAPGGGGGGGGGDGGYTTDPDLSEQHDAEVRATRRRLWGRWASQPRLLPGAIWSRLAFEMRPFVHR
eukprot:Rhum_TRINITY_DN18449_c0_g1::Rhum_TRINITY_DN18449_c0_g1_i1::g.167288::m.167288